MAVRRAAAGRRTVWVRIEQRPATDTVDSSFTPVDGPWTPLADVAAEKSELGGDERFRSQQVSASYDTTWRMRYRADMDPDLVDVPKLRRLLYKTRVHDVVSASVVDRHNGIELTTLAKVG